MLNKFRQKINGELDSEESEDMYEFGESPDANPEEIRDKIV